ncbi:unnamed protein product [Strongylus vulgaris]|uniref:Uncharacterized protein n=1 Tax=Strongylus vulgaris TaxID=40348 RepID=A0A3P7J8W0_STRVU|nr:unnamed protein product [Strongylus vulgaris]
MSNVDCGNPTFECVQSVCVPVIKLPGPKSLMICRDGVCPLPFVCINNFCVSITTQPQPGNIPLTPQPYNIPMACHEGTCPKPFKCINNLCLIGVGCMNNMDCGNPIFECVQSICIPIIRLSGSIPLLFCQNGECPLPYSCLKNYCVAVLSNPQCTTNTHCNDPDYICVHSTCIHRSHLIHVPAICTNYTYCTDSSCADFQMCVNESCPQNFDCYSNLCLPSNQYCEIEEDCPYAHLQCISSKCTYIPKPKTIGEFCELDKQCSGFPQRVCINGLCKTVGQICKRDMDCPEGLRCFVGRCDKQECYKGSQCPSRPDVGCVAGQCRYLQLCNCRGKCAPNLACLRGYCQDMQYVEEVSDMNRDFRNWNSTLTSRQIPVLS